MPAKLGAEVGDRVDEFCTMGAREPVVATACHVVVKCRNYLINLHEELRIFKEWLPVNRTRTYCDWITRRDPTGFMNATEECAGFGVPRPPEVV